MKIVSKIMKVWNGLSHGIAGILGGLIAIGILHWFSLPDHNTIDMLSFTESAFGIGMTVIALVFSLVTVNQVKEIDRRFDEKNKEIDERLGKAVEVVGGLARKVETELVNHQKTKEQSVQPVVASITTVGPARANLDGIREVGGLTVSPTTHIPSKKGNKHG